METHSLLHCCGKWWDAKSRAGGKRKSWEAVEEAVQEAVEEAEVPRMPWRKFWGKERDA